MMMIPPRRWILLLITASYCCLSSIGLTVLLSQVGFVTFAGAAAAASGATIGAPPIRFHDDDGDRRRRHLAKYWDEEEEQWKKSDDRIKSWKSGDYYDKNEKEDHYHEEDKFEGEEEEGNGYDEFKDEEEEKEEEGPEPPTEVLDGGAVSKGGSGSIGIENGHNQNSDGDETDEAPATKEDEDDGISDEYSDNNISIDFKPVLLTFLVPSHRAPNQNNNNNNNRHMILLRRRLEEAAFANFDRAEFTALTSRHVLSELTRESDDVRDVNLVVSPIQTQTSGESSSASAEDAASMVAISVAIDGSVVVPSSVVKRATGSSVRAENVQNMVESAFRGESLKRYARRLQIYSVDPSLREVKNIYMGLPSDISAANTASSNQPTNNDSEGYSNAILIVVGVMGGIALMLICCSVLYLCRRNIVQRRTKFASPSLDGDHSSIPTSEGREDEGRANDVASVQSYQQSEMMSIYVESNNIADQSHRSIEPRTAQKNSPVAERNEQNSSAGAQTSNSTGDFAAVEPRHPPTSPDPRSESDKKPGRHSGYLSDTEIHC